MWARLGIRNFISKTVANNDCCDIFISDFKRIWHKSLSDDELLYTSQKLNPLFEASLDKLREITLNLFEDEKVHKEITEESKSLTVKFECKKMGVKFRFQVVLNEGDGEMLYKEFTMPLLLTLANHQIKEKKLVKIIKEKDAELYEYQHEYPTLKSSYLATEPFSEKEFNNQESMHHQLTDILCNPNAFLDCIHKKLLSMEKLPKIKPEENPLSDKVEKHHIKKEKERDIKETIFKDKNSANTSNNFNPCVKPDHQLIKRRKKQSELLKI